MDPEGLDVGLGEVFVEFPVAVNNRDINVAQFSEKYSYLRWKMVSMMANRLIRIQIAFST